MLDPAVLTSSSSPLQAGALNRTEDALNRTEDGGIKVAVKVQFPNIRRSVESDLGYVKALLTAGSVLPKGLFLERTIKVGSNLSAMTSGKERELLIGCVGYEGGIGGRVRLCAGGFFSEVVWVARKVGDGSEV